jgi:acetylornithine/N-succinyldiaminopimelate aminotransferase
MKMSKSAIMNTYGRKDVFFKTGKGSYLFDENGDKYLDFVMGIATNTLGHCDEEMSKVIKEQASSLIHLSNLYWNYPQTDLGQKLIDKSDMGAVFFCNSGTESVEGALKLALKHGKTISGEKNKLICFNNSFHGRTLGSLKVTNEKYQKDYSVDSSNVIVVDYNDPKMLEEVFDKNVCGVILEPIQGEGGIISSTAEFMEKVRELCDKYESLMILDEVQCGMGRSGEYFAFQKYQVKPDVISLAKGLGGGIPIGAVLVSEKYKDVLKPGDHGSTFGGNPLSCSVALSVIKEIDEKDLLNNVKSMSDYIIDSYESLKEKYHLGEIKGEGLLLGFDPIIENKKVLDKLYEKKVLLVGAGNNVIRILPPLNVEKNQIDLLFEKLDEVFSEIDKC